ncbi:MAG: DsrE family protein [Bacteroidota bacterium]|uniref:Intracellular sulfur oxidation protein, DsrE/DsrF family n=1 Tax=Algoriphagus faecimaris TaxID=686796 RepID=A0A1G6SJJ1_9BACT|nr:DsrE family protein [Algoriphagus faecimaris]SDD16811.1 Intracellular sulfur oxidation protein, DsrE/DsrF family [Algoriphagus faecimaris]
MTKNLSILSLLFVLTCSSLMAQQAQFPIVKGFGGIYEVPEATERPDPSLEYKILVDLITGADNPENVNRYVDNVARLMNLHGLAGVPKERLHVKVVVHGGAIFSILNDEKYQERFKVANPNAAVFEALREGGADILVCGQSLIVRGLKKEDLVEGVEVAHSMLTTATTYVPQGYVMLRF